MRNETRRMPGRWLAALLCAALLFLMGSQAFAGIIVQDRYTDEIVIGFEYTKDEYIINTNTENGVITPNGSVRVKAGENQTFAFTPNVGYRMERILVDGRVVWDRAAATGEPPTGYAFRRVMDDHELEVVFRKIETPTAPPTATATATARATVTPTRRPAASPTPTMTPFWINTPTPSATARPGGGGGGGGGRTPTATPSTRPTTSASMPPLQSASVPPGGGGTTSVPGGDGVTMAPSTPPELLLPDGDVPQAGVAASSVGDCFE